MIFADINPTRSDFCEVSFLNPDNGLLLPPLAARHMGVLGSVSLLKIPGEILFLSEEIGWVDDRFTVTTVRASPLWVSQGAVNYLLRNSHITEAMGEALRRRVRLDDANDTNRLLRAVLRGLEVRHHRIDDPLARVHGRTPEISGCVLVFPDHRDRYALPLDQSGVPILTPEARQALDHFLSTP